MKMYQFMAFNNRVHPVTNLTPYWNWWKTPYTKQIIEERVFDKNDSLNRILKDR